MFVVIYIGNDGICWFISITPFFSINFKSTVIHNKSVNKNLKPIWIGLMVIALLNLLVFIPFVGLFLIFTLAPLLAGYFSGRYEKNYMNAICIGVIWSIMQTIILITILSSFLSFISIQFGVLEFLIIALVFVFNICFCVLGNRCA